MSVLSISLPAPILSLMDRFREAGEEVYVVGGSVRDALMGKTPHDYDLATSALPARTAELFSDRRVIATGMKHGTVTVLVEEEPIEITTFRVDGSYTDARHPDSVTFTDRITEDLARRDFTVNAMAYHPTVGLVDPFGGQEDLRRCLLRTVGCPTQRFSEDALRIMRAFRFAAQLNFRIEEQTLQGCDQSKSGLALVARERIAAEFLRLLTAPTPAAALQTAADIGVLAYVTGGYLPSSRLLSCLDAMPPHAIGRLGLFLAELSREDAAACLKQLKLSNKQTVGACAVQSGLHHAVQTEQDARKLIAACGSYAPLAVHASVLLGISSPHAVAWVEQNRAPCTMAELAVNGKDLQAAGICGKAIGETLHALLDAVLEHPEQNTFDCLLALAKEKNSLS